MIPTNTANNSNTPNPTDSMKKLLGLILLSALANHAAAAAELVLHSPLDWQVAQRETKMAGKIVLRGERPAGAVIEWRVTGESLHGALPTGWQKITTGTDSGGFSSDLKLPAGGWYRLEVRALRGAEAVAEGAVAHVGVGEVFVVAGQSNSANHGEEKQRPRSGKVAAFNGKAWQPANDPQPGASGGGGSFLPPFGDALAERFKVPVGLVATGVGATSVREWLPRGTRFPNPPTLTGQVTQLASGEWECKGTIFTNFTTRLKQLGPLGFRAVLWHQGESDANQRDATRTLPGPLYAQFLTQLIRDSRRAMGWDTPWFVAQASYHVPGDEASPDIRAAQASLWKPGLALEGPDSDALKGDLRERGGKGVHFSGPGLREHAARWVEKVTPWLESQLGGR